MQDDRPVPVVYQHHGNLNFVKQEHYRNQRR